MMNPTLGRRDDAGESVGIGKYTAKSPSQFSVNVEMTLVIWYLPARSRGPTHDKMQIINARTILVLYSFVYLGYTEHRTENRCYTMQ